MPDNFIPNKCFLSLVVLLIMFLIVIQNINKDELTMVSFIDDRSVKELLSKNECFIPKNLNKIDWHDYGLMQREQYRKGLGEHGHPVKLKDQYYSETVNLFRSVGVNELVSNKISLSRSLPYTRHPVCLKYKYIESLPTVSVIIPYYNEHMNTLLRTIHSVFNRSPPQLIKEILLVNDASNLNIFKNNIKNYFVKYEHKVKLIKLINHNGIIRAKLHGALEAKGDVLVFLDAHCEVNVNWLPPLLEPIALDYRTVMCPLIDKIDDFTFAYKATSEYRGGFDWSLNFKRMPLLKEQVRKLPAPYESPVMAGGIFAISRLYFWELGGFDPGLYVWGGDQIELSFKVWLCGGRILIAPCSRVGHVMHRVPLFIQYGIGDFVRRNNLRVAKVWMDKYGEKVYQSQMTYPFINPGDISQQKALRQRLNCKPFNWFMSNVLFDESDADFESFPLDKGQIRSVWDESFSTVSRSCIDADFINLKLSLAICDITRLGHQSFIFTNHNTIKTKARDLCWEFQDNAPNSQIYLRACRDLEESQLWWYNSKTSQIIQRKNCLDWDIVSFVVCVKPCNKYSNTQQWIVTVNILF